MRQRKTVLCVDQYEALLKTMGAVLEGFGYTVLTARTLREALASAAEHKPDAVLLDFNLCPGCPAEGADCAAEKIHAIRPDAKILVWCADASCVRKPPKCAEATLMKPVSPAELAAQLDAVLGQTAISRRAASR